MATTTMRSTPRCNSGGGGGGVVLLLLLLVLSPMVTVMTANEHDDIPNNNNNINAAETTSHHSPQLRGNKYDDTHNANSTISPEFTTDINHRALAGQCVPDPTLIQDAVWYTIELEVFSMEDLKCPAGQWNDVKNFLEDELEKMDLYKDFMITNLSPDLCFNPDAVQRRKLEIRNPDDPSDPGLLIDEDDERFATFLESDEFEEHRRLGWIFFWYDLFFRGGDLCTFCRKDNRDHNSRSLLSGSSSSASSSSLLLESEVDEGAFDVGDDDRAGDKKYYLDGGDDDGDESFTFWAEEDLGGGGDDNDGYLNMYDDDLDDVDDKDMSLWNNGTRSNDESTSRSLRCGGCVRLRGERTNRAVGTKQTRFVRTHEYWKTPLGVKVMAYQPQEGKCLILRKKTYVYDVTDPGQSPNLGAPNQLCDQSGPGVGDGGAPTLSNGAHNRVNSCHLGSTNTAFTVRSPGSSFKGCETEFSISFGFRYPVTLNSMGFMDVADDRSVKVRLTQRIGGRRQEKHYFWVKGGGRNSAPKMAFHGMTNVIRVVVTFYRGGAVRFVDYCQICGDQKKAKQDMVDAFYPDPTDRDVANKDSVTIFKDMIPNLSAVISTELEHALHKEYRRKSSHCLQNANIGVSTIIDVTTKKGARQC